MRKKQISIDSIIILFCVILFLLIFLHHEFWVYHSQKYSLLFKLVTLVPIISVLIGLFIYFIHRMMKDPEQKSSHHMGNHFLNENLLAPLWMFTVVIVGILAAMTLPLIARFLIHHGFK